MSSVRRYRDRVVHRLRAENSRHESPDSGRAIIEVLILAVLLLIPTVYILSAFLRVQSATLAMAQAARDAGRLIDSAPSLSIGVERAREAALIALSDQHIPAEQLTVRFVTAGANCGGAEIVPDLRPGSIFDVCVTTVVTLPGVPSIVTGDRNTVTGAFTLHVGEFREIR